MKIEITPEVIAALAFLRNGWDGDNSVAAIEALNTLNNAHVFSEIDDATGYDVDGPVQIGDNNVQNNTFSPRQIRTMPAYVERARG